MIDVSKLPNMSSFLDIPGYTSNYGSSGKVWLLWKQGVNVSMISHDSQACNTIISKGVNIIFASFVYASAQWVKVGFSGILLSHFEKFLQGSLFICGDFNAMLLENERMGCQSSVGSFRKFSNFLMNIGVIDT